MATTDATNGNHAEGPKLYIRQPAGFGPGCSPRQDLRTGKPFTTWPEARMHLARIVFKSTKEALDSILPAGFEVESGIANTIMFEVMNLRNLPWLAGRGYNTCGVYVNNVVHADSGEKGSFLAVLFESLCDPIITGREELGFPKVYADLKWEGDTYTLSWFGHEFMKLDFTGAEEQPESAHPELLKKKEYTHPMVDGQLAYRYMPAIGRPGEADAEYAVKQPPAKQAQRILSYKTAPEATITIKESSFEDLPTLHNIVNQLAKLPNNGIVERGIYDLQEASDCSKVTRPVDLWNKTGVKRI